MDETLHDAVAAVTAGKERVRVTAVSADVQPRLRWQPSGRAIAMTLQQLGWTSRRRKVGQASIVEWLRPA